MKQRLFALLAIMVLLSTMISALPVQAEIGGDKWNLEDIYKDTAAWEADFKSVEGVLPKYDGYQGKLGDKAKLVDFMTLDEKTSRTIDKLYVYSYMKLDENNSSSEYTEMTGRIESLYADYATACSFFEPELIALPEDTLKAYLKDADLAPYQMLLQNIIDQKAHTLTAEEEAILAGTSELASAPESIYTKITEADLVFPTIKDPTGADVELSEAVYGDLLMDPDRDFREEVYKNMLGTYGTMQNSLAAALDAQVRKDAFYASVRNYDSSIDAALGANSVPKEVYTALVKATNSNLSSLHKYVALRKAILGVDTVRLSDMYVPLVSGYEPREFTYAETQTILADALKPLGELYITDMKASFTGGWIDVYPAEDKTSGAYSWGAFDTHPYILTNYNDSFDSLLTLGHEMGHAMNSYYVNQTQGYYNSNTPIFNAEVASTTNELIILRYMVDNAKTDEEKLFYLNQLAETIRGTFFTQVMYAEFEMQIHERIEGGDGLSVETLNQLWGDILTKYYGEDFELTEEAKLGWSRIPHFYYNFYVYQYATGIAAADQFATDLSAGKSGAAEKYLTFLKAGSSDYPVDVLKAAGVDMLSAKPTATLMADFAATVTEMNDLLVKMGKIDK